MAFLSQSSTSFSYGNVLQIAQGAVQSCQDNITGLFEEFVCEEEEATEYFKSSAQPLSRINVSSEETESKNIVCRMLLDAASKPEDHLTRLDDVFERLVKFRIMYPLLKDDESAQRACAVLERLPADYQEYHEAYDRQTCTKLPSGYFVNEGCPRTTSTLKVTRRLPVPLLQLAILVVLPISERQNWHVQATLAFINMIADYLEYAIYMKPEVEFDASQLLIVRSYLWSLWHRSLSLHRYYVLRVHLEFGFTYLAHRGLRLKGQKVHDTVCNQRQLAEPATQKASTLPISVSTLAYKLLQSDPVLVGADLTALLDRSNEAFPNEAFQYPNQQSDITALQQSHHQTPGQGTQVDDSSVRKHFSHTSTCSGSCPRLVWNESSYRAISGTPAVSLEPIRKGRLGYCECSRRTMTVSQTLINVQDGSSDEAPNTPGISTCLHNTYCEASRKMGCNSYWVHTACVPIDQTMRNEFMNSINAVFEGSKCALIYDHKITSLAAPDAKVCDIASMEKVLATFLLCEWHLGGWALFEAVKGAKNLQLLCKNDIPVSLHEIIESVHTRGSIELSNLLLSLYYLLKPNEIHGLSSAMTMFYNGSEIDIYRRTDTRTLGVEEAGHLLSHRRVRDEEDQILIWSLLTGVHSTNVASQFWSHVSSVHIGYLMSSITRVDGVPNLSWAPVGPGCAVEEQHLISKKQRPLWHDEQTATGDVTVHGEPRLRGLNAVWNFCSLDNLRIGRGVRSAVIHTRAIISAFWAIHYGRSSSYLPTKVPLLLRQLPVDGREWHVPYRMAMNAHKLWSIWLSLQLPAACRRELLRVWTEYCQGTKSVALIHPKVDDCLLEDSLRSSEMVDNFTLAVVTSEQGDQYGATWRWRGLVKWDKNVSLPSFQPRLIRIQ